MRRKGRNDEGTTREHNAESNIRAESPPGKENERAGCRRYLSGLFRRSRFQPSFEGGSRCGGRNRKKVYAVTFDSRLHPACDLEIAGQVAKELGGIHQVISIDELEQADIRMNPKNRCYLCKRRLFSSLKEFAEEKKSSCILDGTNEDDMHVYRPGIQALGELGIISPLAELHITKAEVKDLASLYGISVASRPSTPCMATRIPYGMELNYEILTRIGEGEAFLRELFSGNVRLRLHGNVARIELDPECLEQMLIKRELVIRRLKELGFPYVTLDLEGFRSGSMDLFIEKQTPDSSALL